MARGKPGCRTLLFILLSGSTVLNDFPKWSQIFLAMLGCTILFAVLQMGKIS